MKNPHELQKIAAHMTSAPVWGRGKITGRPTPVSPEADVALEMELLACGFTPEDIEQLRHLAAKSAEAYRFARVDKPVFYRPQARARGTCPFGHSRLYRKAHEVGTKKQPATVVYTPRRGFIRPFPVAK